MITVGMNYQVLHGKEKTFEDAFAAVLTAMGKMPGHSKTGLYRNVQDPQQYLIV